MTKKMDFPRTPRVAEDRRLGVHESVTDVTGLLWYGRHLSFALPRDRELTTAGRAGDRDIVLAPEDVSLQHFVLHRRPEGMVLLDDDSTNGVAYEIGRVHRFALRTFFKDRQVPARGVALTPGMTFVLSAVDGDHHRFIALDDEMKSVHRTLIEILGSEEEVRFSNGDFETPGPSDLLLAADSPGHFLITGKRGCEHEELADIIHRVSQRRSGPFVPVDKLPTARESQADLLKNAATQGTLVVDIRDIKEALDPVFASQLFSSAYEMRVIVIARDRDQAHETLGEAQCQLLHHVQLCPLAKRKPVVQRRLLDQWLEDLDSVMRVHHLTDESRTQLEKNEWRGNLKALRMVAVRFDAIASAGFNRTKAGERLGISRQAFTDWYASLNFKGKLEEMVKPEAKAAIMQEVEERARRAKALTESIEVSTQLDSEKRTA